MKRIVCIGIAAVLFCLCAVVPVCAEDERTKGFLVVTDYIPAGTGTDVSTDLQALIDANPNRTLYFPDGEYLLSRPIATPADPRQSVDLQLSAFAVLRAAPDFDGEALVRLGGKAPYNSTHIPGSNYSLTGGVLDGSGIAGGVTIESGRETAVRNVSIKNTPVGLHIFYGANSGSSDADISDVNIIGTGGTDSIGILVEGFDNTFTNIRIGYVYIGMKIISAGNCMRNIHPLYYSDYTDYADSCAFWDAGGNNIYDYCYSDQFCVGFCTVGTISNVYNDCFCYWYSSVGGKAVGVRVIDGKFNSVFNSLRISFRGDTENAVLETSRFFGSGTFDNLLIDRNRVQNRTYRRFQKGTLFWLFNQLFHL